MFTFNITAIQIKSNIPIVVLRIKVLVQSGIKFKIPIKVHKLIQFITYAFLTFFSTDYQIMYSLKMVFDLRRPDVLQ